MEIEVDPDWWKTLFDEVYLITDARSVCDSELTRREVDVFDLRQRDWLALPAILRCGIAGGRLTVKGRAFSPGAVI